MDVSSREIIVSTSQNQSAQFKVVGVWGGPAPSPFLFASVTVWMLLTEPMCFPHWQIQMDQDTTVGCEVAIRCKCVVQVGVGHGQINEP